MLTIFLTIFLSCSTGSANQIKPWTIEIPLKIGAQTSVTTEYGVSIPLGRVLKIPAKTRYPAYTASAWGQPGHTCASAVNAIHILLSIEKNRGRTISIVPSDTIAPAATPGTAVVIEGHGGYGLFGGWAPPVGTEILIRHSKGGEIKPVSPANLPEEGDSLLLKVRFSNSPLMVDIENRPGGRVILWQNNRARVIARVIHPVGGTGRFGGTLYQSRGKLRANHPGVIDISTSAYGIIGGFQIVPLRHGTSPEMASMWNMTQWMIIAPEGEASLAGNRPLFKDYLLPGPGEGEKTGDIWTQYGRKTLVLCRIKGGPWRKLPDLGGRIDDGLQNVTHLRIYFPSDWEPLSE